MKITVDTELVQRLGSTRALMYEYIKANPQTTYKEIVSVLGICDTAVRNAIDTLERMRYIQRVFYNADRKHRQWIDTEILK